jgi:excisionase family DNA binding protein
VTAPRRVPRLALTRQEAAESLGMSLDSFERHCQPELRLVRRGRLRLVPVAELDRWLDRSAALAVAEEVGTS